MPTTNITVTFTITVTPEMEDDGVLEDIEAILEDVSANYTFAVEGDQFADPVLAGERVVAEEDQ